MRVSESALAVVLIGAVAVLVSGCPEKPTVREPVVLDAGVEFVDPVPPDAGDPCIALSLGEQDFQSNLFGQLTGVRFPVSPGFDDAIPEPLFVELYDSTSPNLPPLSTGTFQLGVPPNDQVVSCQHCIWIPVDWDPTAPVSKLFFATEGSLTLTRVEDPLSPVFAGTATGIVLREATIDETGAMKLVEGGRCARVPPLAFDTSPDPGRPCLSAEDCGNPLVEVCSPATRTCGPLECGEFQGCPAERPVCMSQYGDRLEGACYAECDPTAINTCSDELACLQLGVNPASGICLAIGTGALGDTCELEDTSTSCADGMTCSVSRLVCINSCSYFDAEPGCPAENACTVLGVCDPLSTGDGASFGETCGGSAYLAQGCAAASGAFRGICFGFDPAQPLKCEEACLGDLGCEPEEFCALRFSSGLGICLPDPVCGDGVLGEINEVCDDGNTASNDGCSGDCQWVEYDEICPNAPLLAIGDTSGNTTTGWDGFQATCQLGIARADVYRFAPSSRGRLRLMLASSTAQVISVRSGCADSSSELACGTTFEGNEVIHQITSDRELTVLVSAYTVLEQGPYLLRTEFVPESCGDAIVAGLEVCDDGNTISDDGCSSDCSAIEHDFYCAQAAPLTSSATGNNTGGPNVYDASCSNSIFGSGPERLFRYTAPSSGTVRFRLEPAAGSSADLVLAVFDNCGAPATMNELGCSSVYGIEQVDLPVTAGQTVTVVVEGFHGHSVSAFTLTAQMM